MIGAIFTQIKFIYCSKNIRSIALKLDCNPLYVKKEEEDEIPLLKESLWLGLLS